MAERKGNAKDLITLWETKNDSMLGGDVEVEKLEELCKAARVGGKPMVKFLAFKNQSRTGKKILNILAEPADKYVKGGGSAPEQKPRSSW